MDDDGPLAYFITFSTYGTRLHGDDRGSISRTRNHFGTPGLAPDPKLSTWEGSLLRNPPQLLDEPRRTCVRDTIERVCLHRNWTLATLNVRTNHVHLVVTADLRPEYVMRSLKSWATRDLVSAGLLEPGTTLWTRHGSTRYLWNAASFEAACAYVRDGQGIELPGSVRTFAEDG